MPLLASLVVLLVVALVYRGLLLSLPFFEDALAQNAKLNVVSGAASDVAMVTMVASLILLLAAATPRRHVRAQQGAVGLLVALMVASLMTHLRFVEHFGMNVRPYHFTAMGTGEVWWVGTLMVLGSWRVDVLGGAAVLVALATRKRFTAIEARWRAGKAGVRFGLVAATLLLFAVANSTSINTRMKVGVHAELRYSPYASLYYNWVAFRKVAALPLPAREDLLKLRTLLGGERDYVAGVEMPLWQKSIASARTATGEFVPLRQKFRAFLEAERQAKGPWNVVLLISESLRAQEIQALGEAAPERAGLTPQLDLLIAKSVTFTEVISAGLRTHFGQTTSNCSLYGTEGFTILSGAPMANATCISDIFARRGYATHFFYGADNHFDNQDVFYKRHRVRYVHGAEEMPRDAARAGWGVSDATLFAFTEKTLAAEAEPFFASVLTLSNHSPFKMPEDVPPGLLREDLPVEAQLLQYVDWSVGKFIDAMGARFPHTLFVVVADHGKYWGEPSMLDRPTFEHVRRVARIPLLFYVPSLPEELRGARVTNLASNVDVPPTLMSLLGWIDEPQQFMGEDAFARRGPVYMDWYNTFFALKNGQIEAVPEELEAILGAAGRFNQLAPAAP